MLVRATGRVLPKPVFDLEIAGARAIYRGAGLLIYGLRRQWAGVSGDQRRFEMATRVREVLPYTFVGTGGLEATYEIAALMNERKVPGAFVELGVARGGCAALLAGQAFKVPALDRRLWLFDSFEGLPDPTEDDMGGSGLET